MQLARIELAEILVARQHVRESPRAFRPLPREQHPQVLHRRPAAAVVEVHEVGAAVGPQDVAGVAVAVQPQGRHRTGALVRPPHAAERHVHHARVGVLQIRGNPARGQQIVARLLAEACDVQRRPVRERPHRAHDVDAADEPTDPLEHLRVVEFRHPPPAAGIDREPEALVLVQRSPEKLLGSDHGNLAFGELPGEFVLLEDRGVRPSTRPVELRHHGRPVLEVDLIDAVLVAVQREEPTVPPQTHAFERVEHAVRGESGVRRRFSIHAPILCARRKSSPVGIPGRW